VKLVLVIQEFVKMMEESRGWGNAYENWKVSNNGEECLEL